MLHSLCFSNYSLGCQWQMLSHHVIYRTSRQTQEQVQHLGVVGRAQASVGIPSLDSWEAIGATAGVGAVGDVVEHFRMPVQHGIDEAQRTFTHGNAFFDDAVDDGGKDGSAGRGAVFKDELAVVEEGKIVSVGSNICSKC